VLIEFGLPEKLAETLVESGIGSIEKLGAMTPEQLEEIPDIGSKMVVHIQEAVNAYYGQFEAPEEAAAGGESAPEQTTATVDAAEQEPADETAPAGEEEAGNENIGLESMDSESGTIKDSGQIEK
jgi:N utilization substance protein A